MKIERGNSVNKSNLQFSGARLFTNESVGDLTLTQFLKHVIIPVMLYKYSKTPHWRLKKSEIVATQAAELSQTVALSLFRFHLSPFPQKRLILRLG